MLTDGGGSSQWCVRLSTVYKRGRLAEDDSSQQAGAYALSALDCGCNVASCLSSCFAP